MKSLQLTNLSSSDTLLKNVTYLQIGVQSPYNIPITELEQDDPFQLPVIINDKHFTITDRDILEFSDFHFQGDSIKIAFGKTNKFVIVDLIYETAD